MLNTLTVREYARIGAAARLTELQNEISQIRQMFPDLDSAARPSRRPGRPRVNAALRMEHRASPVVAAESPARKRRTLSAAARKAIGDAQRKRWAKLKAGKK
jgi:hypothetical protein